jgi:hypothetical protein
MFRSIPGIEGSFGRTYKISKDWIVFSIDKKGNMREIKEDKKGRVNISGKRYVIYELAKLVSLPPKEWPEDKREWEEIKVDTALGFRYRAFEGGDVQSMNQHGKVLDKTLTKNSLGYMIVKINTKSIKVHQLMGETRFVPKPPNMPFDWTVHHKDKNRSNNHYTNLEWAPPDKQAKDKRPMEQPKITSYTIIATAQQDIVLANGTKIVKGDTKLFDTTDIAVTATVGSDRGAISRCINGTLNTHAGFSWKTQLSDPEFQDEVFMSVGSGIQYERFLSAHGRIKYAFHHGYSKILEAEEMMSDRQRRETDVYPSIRINGKSVCFHRQVVELFLGTFPTTIEIDGKKHRMIVDHIDDVKDNARLGNLQFLTQQENSQKRYLKSYMTSVASFVDGKYEKSHDTRAAAIEFIKTEYPNATLEELNAAIELMMSANVPAKLYGRSWIRAHFESKNAYE